MFCKDCAHFYDEYENRSPVEKFFSLLPPRPATCGIPEFADKVYGKPILCEIVRMSKCNGEPPYFSPKKMAIP